MVGEELVTDTHPAKFLINNDTFNNLRKKQVWYSFSEMSLWFLPIAAHLHSLWIYTKLYSTNFWCVHCFLQDFSYLWAFRASQAQNTRVLVPQILTSRQHCETWCLVVVLGNYKKKEQIIPRWRKLTSRLTKKLNNKNHRGKKQLSLLILVFKVFFPHKVFFS